MSDGLTTLLPELIALQRQVNKVRYQPNHAPGRTGAHRSKLRGRGMDFTEARNYQAGDEIRHMEWRVTARTGRPHVKIYQEERERPVIILTDFNPSMYFGTRIAFKSVVAARLSALIAWTGAQQGDRIGGLLFSASTLHEFTPKSRQAGVLPLLNGLCAYTNDYLTQLATSAKDARSLSSVLIRLRRVIRPGSVVVLISDFYGLNDEAHQQLNNLRRTTTILAYHVCDSLEITPPKPQYYPITDGQSRTLIDTSLDSVTKAYQQTCDGVINRLKTNLEPLGIQYETVTAASDLTQLVHQSFPRRVGA